MAKANPGVSVVIVTRDGALRLPPTLDHLIKQEVDPVIPWEVIVVDNASKDKTKEVVRIVWTSSIPLRIIDEPAQGVAFVRKRGIEEAKYEFILFVDDDNWLAPEWIRKIFSVFLEHPDIGMTGGFNTGVFETPVPGWIVPLLSDFAIGPQGDVSGDITDSRGYVWGAGMAFRKSVYIHLRKCGFIPLLAGRKAGKLTPGEDAELSFLFKAAGFRIWYFSDLQLQHYIPTQRMSWEYCIRLYKGFGESTFILDLYNLALKDSKWPYCRICFKAIKEFIYTVVILLLHLFEPEKVRKYLLLFIATKAKLAIVIKNISGYRAYYSHIRRLLQNLKAQPVKQDHT
jgi:glycosyltransferase involved in cell wall biosynthesis